MEHEQNDPDEVQAQGVGRRTVIRGAAAGLAGAWAAPVITSFTSPAFAAGSKGNPNPECRGSGCSNFIPCSSGNADCVCATTSTGGGFCVPGSTSCGPACGPGNTCGPDEVCLVDTCCGMPVCIPVSANQACPPDADGGAKAFGGSAKRESRPGTIGG